MPKINQYTDLCFDFELKPNHSIYKSVKYKRSGYLTYYNVQHLLYKLNNKERCFLEYLVEHSDSNNRIYVDTNLKGEYMQFLKDAIKEEKPITLNQLDKTIGKLNDLGLIIRKASASYWVNPKYFWHESESKRMSLLKTLVIDRAKSGLPVNHLINCEEKEFLQSVN